MKYTQIRKIKNQYTQQQRNIDLIDELLPDAMLYCIAKAKEETIREIVEPIQKKTLEAFKPHFDYETINNFYRDKRKGFEGDRVTAETLTEKNLFLLHGKHNGERNKSVLKDYYEELQHCYVEAKLKDAPDNFCPLLCAESDTREIEGRIIKTWFEANELNESWDMEKRKQIFDLLMTAIVSKHSQQFERLTK